MSPYKLLTILILKKKKKNSYYLHPDEYITYQSGQMLGMKT